MPFIIDCLKASFIQFSRMPFNGRNLKPEHFALSVNYLPIVGMLIGLTGAALGFILLGHLSQTSVSICMVIMAIILTGAIHEDGLADSFDGLFGGLNKEKRLLIMKDSSLGTYGALSLISVLGLKISLMVSLPTSIMLISFISVQSMSRIAPLFIIATSSYASTSEASKMTASIILSKYHALPVICFILLFNFLLIPVTFILLILTCIITVSVMGKIFFQKKIEGYNGDCLGGIQQITECILLIAFSLSF